MMIVYLLGIILLALVSIVFVFLRPNRARLAVRLLASFSVIAGMSLLVIPIFNAKSLSGKTQLLILTEGYQEDSVVAYQQSNSIKLSWEALNQAAIDQADAIAIFGYGLPDTSIWKIPPAKTKFHTSNLPRGISHIHWKQEMALGQSLLIQGRVSNPKLEKLVLQLLSGQELVEQKMLIAQPFINFQFNPSPKNLGTGNYQLVLLKGKDTLSNNPIPFIVALPKSISVLLLQDAPGFEQKFLKNWLTDHGYPLAARTRISKQIFDQAFSNRASSNLLNINANLLAGFDLLLTDEASLNSLSPMEQYQIRTAIREQGLGLLVTTDTILKHAPILDQTLSIKPVFDSTIAHHYLKMQGHDSAWHPMLQKESWLVIEPNPQIQSLVTDAKGRILTGLYAEGMGRIGFSTIDQTHYWSLGSKQWDYDFYWTQLLESLTSQRIARESWSMGANLNFLSHPTEVVQWKDTADHSTAIVSGAKVYLQEDPLYPFKQIGKFWPNQSGWQNLITNIGQIKPWYVFESKDWLLVQWSQRMAQTKALLSQTANDLHIPSSKKKPAERQLIPPIWAWLILLLGLTVLWIESKLE